MNTLWQDLRYGVRMLLKRPGFTVVAVITLALGIGANTAIFSVLDAVLLKPLPFADPGRLVMVWEKPPKYERNAVSVATFLDWKNQNRVFEQMAAFWQSSVNLSGTEQPEMIPSLSVSANYFELLGVQTALGRTFQSDEDQPGKPRVVVLSHRLWQRRFGGDPRLIGREITLDGERRMVIGVLKPNSSFDRSLAQIYDPLVFNQERRSDRNAHFLNIYARLKPGITLEQAQAEMNIIAAGVAARYPETNKGWHVAVDGLRDWVVGNKLRQTILVLFGAVIFVLLIACSNLANLMLARVSARWKEISIRSALGATRFQLTKQFLTESLLLVLPGGALGVILGYWLVKVFTLLMPESVLPPEAMVTLDHRVLLFALAASLLTGVIFGLVPAWQASKSDLNEALKESGSATTASARRQYLSRLLIVSEVALALVLLTGSGLLIRSLFSLQRAELGFQPANVLAMHLSLPWKKYQTPERVAAFYGELLQRVKSLPGAEQAGVATSLPTTGWENGQFFSIAGHPPVEPSERPGAHFQRISPDYFRTLGIPVIKGRSFTEQDHATAPRVVIINETLARRYFPGEEPLGQHLLFDSPAPYQIVGIVGNVRVYGLGSKEAEENPEIYVHHVQRPDTDMYLAVRTVGSPQLLANAVQREIRALDQDQPVTRVSTLEEIVAETVSGERFNALLLSFFAAVALTLSAIGLYSVISYAVAQHTREIGIRMALGAQRSDVLKLIIGQGILIVAAGAATGLGAAFVVTRVMASLLYHVSATDPATFVITPLLLVAVSWLACYLPARRAMKVDPMVALRYE
jgi:putative ABC transport system permease protein